MIDRNSGNYLDKIQIKNLEIFANHGVFQEENRLGQKFLLSLTMYLDTRAAGRKDDLKRSVDYGEVSAFVTRCMQERPYKLIEAAAEHLAEELLLRYPLLLGVELELQKPWAPVGLPLETVSVEISRFWHWAYLGLGSNMGDKKAYLDQAVRTLDELRGCKVEKVSSYLVTKPYGGVEQDDFLNACLCLKTWLPPHELLERLHEIEQNAHRERIIHWGPRTLDLDLLLYDDEVVNTEDLIVPHAEMHLREFVLRPLTEIAPGKRHPLTGKTAAQMLAEIEKEAKE